MKMLFFLTKGRLLVYLYKVGLILLFCLGLGYKGFCQKQKLSSTLESFRKASVEADIKTLKELTSDKLSYGHSNGLIENKEQFVDNIRNESSRFVGLDFEDPQISIEDNVFIVRNIWKCNTHNKGSSPNVFSLSVLTVWKTDKMNNIVLFARQAIKHN